LVFLFYLTIEILYMQQNNKHNKNSQRYFKKIEQTGKNLISI